MNPTLQAFKEIFPYLETIDARTETIMQLLRTRGMINQISFDEKFTEVKHRTHVKWDALRVKLDNMMKEEHP
jgi:hypothetical protein